jgi:hypothetical protein
VAFARSASKIYAVAGGNIFAKSIAHNSFGRFQALLGLDLTLLFALFALWWTKPLTQTLNSLVNTLRAII